MQRLFHDLAPRLNRPITWGPELPAELVMGVSFDRWRAIGDGALVVRPHGGASLGTLLTEARAGADASYRVELPTKRVAPKLGRMSAVIVADAQARLVAHNVVLSGTVFRTGPRVPLRPVVGEWTTGVRLGWRSLEASWLAHQTGAEHRGQARAHRWSTLELSWRPAR
jgi:hypothetical protein